MLFLSSADLFQNHFFRKIISGMPSQCQTVWIQIKPDVLLGLIWVQTVCKSYQQITLVGVKHNGKVPLSVANEPTLNVFVTRDPCFWLILGNN